MTTLNVTVKPKTSKGQTLGWEGTVTTSGLKPTKLSRSDGTTLFETTGALKAVARSVGRRFGATVEYTELAKIAAKKSVRSKTAEKPKTKAKPTAEKPKTKAKPTAKKPKTKAKPTAKKPKTKARKSR